MVVKNISKIVGKADTIFLYVILDEQKLINVRPKKKYIQFDLRHFKLISTHNAKLMKIQLSSR